MLQPWLLKSHYACFLSTLCNLDNIPVELKTYRSQKNLPQSTYNDKQKQPSRGVLMKKCFKNMQQIY